MQSSTAWPKWRPKFPQCHQIACNKCRGHLPSIFTISIISWRASMFTVNSMPTCRWSALVGTIRVADRFALLRKVRCTWCTIKMSGYCSTFRPYCGQMERPATHRLNNRSRNFGGQWTLVMGSVIATLNGVKISGKRCRRRPDNSLPWLIPPCAAMPCARRAESRKAEHLRGIPARLRGRCRCTHQSRAYHDNIEVTLIGRFTGWTVERYWSNLFSKFYSGTLNGV